MALSTLYLIAAAIVALLIVYLQRTTVRPAEEGGEDNEDEAEVVGGRARGARARLRQGAAVPGTGGEEGEEGADARRLGKKKLASMQRKEMKKRVHEHELQVQDERRKREELLAEDRAKDEEEAKKRQAREVCDNKREELLAEDRAKDEEEAKKRQAREAEEERKVRAAREAEERAAYEAMKGLITVEGEGTQAAEDAEVQLSDFIDFVNSSKLVTIDALAAKFRLKPLEVVDRLQGLERDGRLLGVLDDRGKYISLTMEELEKIAQFIDGRGRVSVTELTQAVNRMVHVSKNETINKDTTTPTTTAAATGPSSAMAEPVPVT